MVDPMSIGAIVAAVVSLIGTIFTHMRQSRCTRIICCCCEIDRDVVDSDI